MKICKIVTVALAGLRERSARACYLSAQSLIQLGDTHHTAGDTQAARHTWQQALAILDDLHPSEASQIRSKLHDPR